MTLDGEMLLIKYQDLLERYRTSETMAQKKLPFLAQAAFQPIHFLAFAWPTRLKNIEDLKNLSDSMHETRGERWLSRLKTKGGPNSDDVTLMESVAEQAGPMFKALSLPAPDASLVNAFYQLRIINDNFPESCKVLEIGPGSGWLSLLLALSKRRILIALEATENFYVWQSLLFERFPKINLIQTLDGYCPAGDTTKSSILHVPWWESVELRRMPVEIDLVVANHVVCEMHEHSLRHILKLATTCKAPPHF